MKRLVYLLPLLVFLVIGVYFAVGLTKDPRKLESVLINQPAPDINLPPIKGSDRGLGKADFLGHVSLVNIFGSWCIACKLEHPFLMKIKEKGLVPLYGIDWREKNRDDGPNWLASRGDPYTLVGDDPNSKAAIGFGVYGAPETFLIDGKGVIRYKHVGVVNDKVWGQTLWPLIKELRKQ